MKTIRDVALTIAMLIPLAELVLLPIYMAHRATVSSTALMQEYDGSADAGLLR